MAGSRTLTTIFRSDSGVTLKVTLSVLNLVLKLQSYLKKKFNSIFFRYALQSVFPAKISSKFFFFLFFPFIKKRFDVFWTNHYRGLIFKNEKFENYFHGSDLLFIIELSILHILWNNPTTQIILQSDLFQNP